jgi:hypothetical protein
MNLKTSLAGWLLLMLPVAGLAAEQGELGTSSAANFTIALSIQPSIEINTVRDINLTITDRSVDATFSKPFCVQGSTGRYTIIASGNILGGDAESGNFDPLVPGIPSATYDVLSRDTTCNELTAFMVTFLAEDLQKAGSGLYTGALILLVSPV